MNPQFDSIGRQFVDFYYKAFDENRSTLAALYRPESMMTFEGAQHQGPEAIVQKLVSLPFQKVQHVVTTVDCQPTVDFGVLVMVVGQLKTDEDPIHGFSQTFILKNDGSNYYVLSDIFRLVVHSA
ncbi:PREDICTED: nuclear transport factor 2-like [Branchiostoma belcheri]|uniref:Nuclear transport factor 2 n=1 Tax=Branchiostoma belcheri TaxID=7741 RepID=A0A6P4Z710_BRABE|nr:PREDICTED: nuclear transport factor 2-like [Branchiostoma belcheri]